MRALPLMSMAQEPQIFFEAIGVVGDRRGALAVRVDGLAAMSISDEDDVHAGALGELELLPVGLDVGFAWRLISMRRF